MFENVWYIVFGTTIVASFVPLFLSSKKYIYITLHHMEMSKEEIISKKRNVDGYIFLTYILYELSYVCLQAIIGNKYGLLKAIVRAVVLLIKTGVTIWFFGIFTKIFIKVKDEKNEIIR